MERIPISEWEQQASYLSHTTPSFIAPTVSECRSDITNYPTTALQPAADDKQQRPPDDITTSSSTAACPVDNNTSRSTNTNRLNDDDEEDSDEEIGVMVYASSKTARARRATAEAASASVNSNQSSSSYEPRSEVRKRKSLSNSNSSSKEMESAVKKKRVTKSFEQRVADLQAYKEEHGHVNVKQRDDESLYKFCGNMRHARNNPEKSTMTLTDERIASLNALGFEWAVIERKAIKSFEQRIEDLLAYKEKNGHVNVKGSEDRSLYSFCNHMRQARNNPEKSNTLINDDRIASLDALGFDWAVTVTERAAKKSFEQRMDDLRAYRERHGHVNVKEREDKSLYIFCYEMRRARNNPGKSGMLINEERIASFDALGFNWTTRERGAQLFAQRIDDLQAYKEKHGHVNVKKSEDRSLNDFCRNIRRARKHPEKSNTVINDDRIASLDALGFEWNPDSKSAPSLH